MHIDKYVVNNIGTKWTNGKSKKNSVLGTIDGLDIDLKKLVPLLEQWHETLNGEWSTREIELVINIKDDSNHV
jgi:hypothetical protein